MSWHPSGSRALTVTGCALVAAGLALLAFLGYQLVGTAQTTERSQQHLRERFDQYSRQTPDPASRGGEAGESQLREPALGDPVAKLRIPRLGKTWRFVVVQGVGAEQLAQGPGHVPGTAMPGELGNFAVAGHRVTYAHPFYDLNELRPGDRIDIRAQRQRLTYTVTGTSIVDPSDTSVIAPERGKRLMTLITCHPRYSARERLVVHAELMADSTRKDG